MISRRAEETDSRTGWVMIAVFALVLVITFIAFSRFDILGKLEGILPSYNQSTPNTGGEVILGYNFAEGQPYYYSGSSFSVLGRGTTTLFNKQFEYSSMNQEFIDFIRGEGSYSSARKDVPQSVRIPLLRDELFGPNGTEYDGSFFEGVPELGVVVTGFSSRWGETFMVQGIIGPYSVIRTGAIPATPTSPSQKGTHAYGSFLVHPSGRVEIFPVDSSFTGFSPGEPLSFSVDDSSLGSIISLRTFASSWRDSIFTGGSAPQTISLSYVDTGTKQSVTRTVPVEKKDLFLIARIS